MHVPAFLRTERGERQDAATAMATIVYYLRPYILRALKPNIDRGANHALRKNLYGELSSGPLIAALTARAVIDVKFTAYWRYLAASKDLDWSNLDTCAVYEATLDACRVPRDRYASTFFDPAWNPFGEIAKAEPAFAAHVASLADDVKTAAFRTELFHPAEATNVAARDLAYDILEVWLKGIASRIRSGQGARRVGDGDLANPDAAMIEAFDGTWRNTNILERTFAMGKAYDKKFDNISSANAFAVSMCQQNELFPRSARTYVQARTRTPKTARAGRTVGKPSRVRAGRLERLPSATLRLVVTTARRSVKRRRDEEEADVAEVYEKQRDADAEADKRVREKRAKALVAATDAYATAPVVADEDLAGTPTAAIVAAIDAALVDKSPNAQHEYLKGQLKRVAFGMGHTELKPSRWTSTKDAGIAAKGTPTNISFLRHALVRAMAALKDNGLSLEPAAPKHEAASAKVFVICEPTPQRVALDALTMSDHDEVVALAEQIRADRAAKAADAASRRPALPEVTADLVGRRVEVVHRFDDGEDWFCPGEIIEIATPETRHHRKKVPLGRFYVDYDDFAESDGVPNLDPEWIDATRKTYYESLKVGAWRFERATADDDEADGEADADAEADDDGARERDDLDDEADMEDAFV